VGGFVALGLVRFRRIGPEPGSIQRIKVGHFQSWFTLEQLFGSTWPGMEMDPDGISPFSFWPRTNPHLLRCGTKSPPSRLALPSPDTHAQGKAKSRRREVAVWRRDLSPTAGTAMTASALLFGNPSSLFYSPTLGFLLVAAAAAAGVPSIPPTHWNSHWSAFLGCVVAAASIALPRWMIPLLYCPCLHGDQFVQSKVVFVHTSCLEC
jgi:hypothetical protein